MSFWSIALPYSSKDGIAEFCSDTALSPRILLRNFAVLSSGVPGFRPASLTTLLPLAGIEQHQQVQIAPAPAWNLCVFPLHPKNMAGS